MGKRLFQVLDEMNQSDIKNGPESRSVGVSYTLISADKVKQGTQVSMGADHQAIIDIMTEKVVPILILVNKEEYLKIEKEP